MRCLLQIVPTRTFRRASDNYGLCHSLLVVDLSPESSTLYVSGNLPIRHRAFGKSAGYAGIDIFEILYILDKYCFSGFQANQIERLYSSSSIFHLRLSLLVSISI